MTDVYCRCHKNSPSKIHATGHESLLEIGSKRMNYKNNFNNLQCIASIQNMSCDWEYSSAGLLQPTDA